MAEDREVEWVVFDLGETLVDETNNWGRWADYLGVPRLTFFAVLGSVIAARRPHVDVFGYFRPDFDLDTEVVAKLAAGYPWTFDSSDLYPDALPTLRALRTAGYRLAVIGNQTSSASAFMAGLPVELTATSDQWAVSKPDPAFFGRMEDELGVSAERIAYVGDRVDNDVLPARRAGMVAVHLRRGPWGIIHSEWPEAAEAHIRLDALTELEGALTALRG
ncbi:MAG TPA: HAD family hydrolase [Acidimicrobiales bacterium]|nr:HAD family hydrolase [Acidimicrobiales bacterium]